MTTSRTCLSVTIALVLGASACAGRVGIIALEDKAGSCAVAKPKIVVDTKKSDPKFLGMAWVVQNSCDKERTVAIAGFKRNATDVEAPVDCKGTFEVTLPEGSIGIISCVVKSGAEGKYKYTVKLNGKDVDPELIIKRR
jgi:hypothetical protein